MKAAEIRLIIPDDFDAADLIVPMEDGLRRWGLATKEKVRSFFVSDVDGAASLTWVITERSDEVSREEE